MGELMITISEFPPRSRPLSTHEITGVFGGCKAAGEVCYGEKECCNECDYNRPLLTNPP
jgi:hypothetical protein